MKEIESSLKSHAESIGNGFTTSEVETTVCWTADREKQFAFDLTAETME